MWILCNNSLIAYCWVKKESVIFVIFETNNYFCKVFFRTKIVDNGQHVNYSNF